MFLSPRLEFVLEFYLGCFVEFLYLALGVESVIPKSQAGCHFHIEYPNMMINPDGSSCFADSGIASEVWLLFPYKWYSLNGGSVSIIRSGGNLI